MPDRLRAGIIGTGFIGGVHAHAVRASGHVIGLVAGSTPDRAVESAHRLGALGAAESAYALIASDDIDVVHICTPNSTHADLAAAALAAGRSVICEKPLATSVYQPAGQRPLAYRRTDQLGQQLAGTRQRQILPGQQVAGQCSHSRPVLGRRPHPEHDPRQVEHLPHRRGTIRDEVCATQRKGKS